MGRSGFFLEGVSAEISAVQLSRLLLLLLLLLVFPGASDFGPPQWWRQFWARGAFGSSRRAPGEQVPDSLPQVNAHAGSPG